MSILDKLRDERDDLDRRKAADARREAQLRAAYEKQIRPALHDAYHYFKEFFEHLDVLNKETGVAVEMDDFGPVRSLRPGRHFVRVDKSDQIGQVICGRKVTGKDLSMRLKGRVSFEAMEARLENCGFRFERRVFHDENGEVSGGSFLVPMNFVQAVTFSADVPSSSVDVTVAHFRRFGVNRRRFRPEQVIEALFDDIGAYLLGETEALFRTELAPEARDKLQRAVQEERAQRDREVEAGRQERNHHDELRDQSRSLREFYDRFRGRT